MKRAERMRNVSHWDRSAGEDQHVGLVILVVLAGAVIFGVFFFWNMSGALRAPSIDLLGGRNESLALARPGSGYQPQAQPTPAVQAAEQAQPAAQAQPQPTVQPTAAPATGTARVAHTDGVGVVLRSSPNEADKLPRGFMDGTEVTILQRQGTDWARVRGANGQEGWVPTKYLDQ
jgi:Bacterial SH3 domain/FAM75 family